MKSLSFISAVSLFCVLSAQAEPVTQSSTLFGKKLSVTQDSSASPSNQGLSTGTQIQFIGKQRSLMEASIEAIPAAASDVPAAASDGTPSASPAPDRSITLAKTDLYIGGTRVWNGTLKVDKGGLVYSGGVAPTQIPFPLFVYPLGPVVLQLDAGIEFEGQVEASILPGISIPIEDMTIDAKLQAELYAAGYVEGSARLLFVRAGVGGRVNFIDGSTGVAAHIYFNGTKPQASGFGKVVLLNGSVYGFVDSTLLFGGWKRWLSKDFFKWPGKCFAFGEASCASQ
jgi:hypothetical protein